MSILRVNNVGKSFREYHSEWHRFARWFGVPTKPPQEHWVLRNIDFDVHAGEAVGIIGKNGAGKSTLLKMIAGTLKPTEGDLSVKGRVAAILELGMGFNPELTGRQNVRHAAGLMGLGVEEIERAMSDIENFAEIGEYFDEPVRTYSSGMHVRVAFSVATAYRPDILIVDEALSVGDASFQRRCFQRMEDYQRSGTSLLFVSHDIESIKRLCDSAIFLNGGRVDCKGTAKQVCDEYEKHLFGGQRETTVTPSTDNEGNSNSSTAAIFDPSLEANCELVYGNGKAEIESCWIENLAGQRINVIESGSPFRWRYKVKFCEAVTNPVFAMLIKTLEGVSLYGVDSSKDRSPIDHYNAGDLVDVTFQMENALAPGEYYLNCGVKVTTQDDVEFLCRRVDSAILRVTSAPESTATSEFFVELNAELGTKSSQKEASKRE